MRLTVNKTLKKLGAMLLAVCLVLGGFPPLQQSAQAASANSVKVIQIAAAQNNSIALKSDGTVIAWGNQVTSWAKPPEGLTGVVEIYAKDTTFLARKSNGMLVAWGSNNVGETTIPQGLVKVISMAAAGSHTLAVSETGIIGGVGKVYAWGLNGNGQSVVPTGAQDGVTKVAAGTYYSMALKFDGTVVDWGSNGEGATLKPSDLSNVVAIDAGYMYALALKSNGTVVAWGKESNENGILDVTGLSGITAISANGTHALALKNDGTVVGWGDNMYGKATPPAGLTDVVAVSAGRNHSLALKSDGTVVSWGSQTSVPGDDKLSGLTISGGELSPAFSPTGESYHVDIAEATSTVRINAVLTDTAYTALYINDQLQASGTDVAVSVPPVGTVVTVRVEPYIKPSRTYTITISRDRTPPVIQFTPNGSANPLRGIDTIVQVTDATSGVKESALEYVWTQSEEEPSSGWAPFSLLPYTQYSPFVHNGADGKWYLHIRAADFAGNEMYARSEPFLIDNTPPVLHVAMNIDTVDGDEYTDDTWTNQSVVVSAAATDAQSDIVTIKYTLDGGASWTDYTVPFTLSTNEIHSVIFHASDALGNMAVESRKVKISNGNLKLTPVLTFVSDGSEYESGTWTNRSVDISISDVTGDHDIDSIVFYVNNHYEGTYREQEIMIAQQGTFTFVFEVTDVEENVLTVPLVINIDRTNPIVAFSLNGNDGVANREAIVTPTVTDSGGSGLLISSLEYVWTQMTDQPTVGWQPLNNGSPLKKENVDGDWYLHIQAEDAAGNYTHAVSGRFALAIPSLDSQISPDTVSFDKKASVQADIITTVTPNGNTLTGISNGSEPLVSGADYTVTGNTVVISRNYLAMQPVGQTSLTFAFSGGANQILTIEVSDSTPVFTVTYNANGSTGGTVPNDSGLYPQGAGVDVYGNSGNLSKTGHTFAGWNTQADGTGTSYAAGASFLMGSADVSLYAMWVINNDGGNGDNGNNGNNGDSGDNSTEPPTTEEPLVEQPPTDEKPSTAFDDTLGHWAEAYIKQAVDLGIVEGYPDGTFKPNRIVTRAEFTVMLMNMLKLQDTGAELPFTDTMKIGLWARKAIAQAVQAGIINGYEDGSFRPDAEITRVEMASMLAKAAGVSLEANAASGFADDKDIPVWAKGAVAAIKKLGLIQGKGSNEFDPNASTTRAEAVTVLIRMLNAGKE